MEVAYPDAEGRFEFASLRPGPYRVLAQRVTEASGGRWIPDLGRMAQVEVEGGATTEIEIPVLDNVNQMK